MSDANADQIEHWDSQAGPVWVDYQERLDIQIAPHGERALASLAPASGERVLDVGCGCGATALEIARRVGPSGHVLGLDISGPMLARARQRAAQADLEHIEFRQSDAQTAPLEPGAYDALFSRFGVMFFDDPGAAFANLGRALRPGGRLAFACWQPPTENPWILAPMAAVAPLLEMPPPPPPGSPGMFGLADPERVRTLLGDAGFVDVAIDDVRLDMSPGGGSLDDAVDTFLEVGPVAAVLRDTGADDSLRGKVHAAVRTAYEQHDTAEGPRLPSAIWLVTAHR